MTAETDVKREGFEVENEGKCVLDMDMAPPTVGGGGDCTGNGKDDHGFLNGSVVLSDSCVDHGGNGEFSVSKLNINSPEELKGVLVNGFNESGVQNGNNVESEDAIKVEGELTIENGDAVEKETGVRVKGGNLVKENGDSNKFMNDVEVDGGVSLVQDSVDTKSGSEFKVERGELGTLNSSTCDSECNETSIEAKDEDEVGGAESSVVDDGTGELKSEFKFKYGEAATENSSADNQERGDGEDAMAEESVMEYHGNNNPESKSGVKSGHLKVEMDDAIILDLPEIKDRELNVENEENVSPGDQERADGVDAMAEESVMENGDNNNPESKSGVKSGNLKVEMDDAIIPDLPEIKDGELNVENEENGSPGDQERVDGVDAMAEELVMETGGNNNPESESGVKSGHFKVEMDDAIRPDLPEIKGGELNVENEENGNSCVDNGGLAGKPLVFSSGSSDPSQDSVGVDNCDLVVSDIAGELNGTVVSESGPQALDEKSKKFQQLGHDVEPQGVGVEVKQLQPSENTYKEGHMLENEAQCQQFEVDVIKQPLGDEVDRSQLPADDTKSQMLHGEVNEWQISDGEIKDLQLFENEGELQSVGSEVKGFHLSDREVKEPQAVNGEVQLIKPLDGKTEELLLLEGKAEVDKQVDFEPAAELRKTGESKSVESEASRGELLQTDGGFQVEVIAEPKECQELQRIGIESDETAEQPKQELTAEVEDCSDTCTVDLQPNACPLPPVSCEQCIEVDGKSESDDAVAENQGSQMGLTEDDQLNQGVEEVGLSSLIKEDSSVDFAIESGVAANDPSTQLEIEVNSGSQDTGIGDADSLQALGVPSDLNTIEEPVAADDTSSVTGKFLTDPAADTRPECEGFDGVHPGIVHGINSEPEAMNAPGDSNKSSCLAYGVSLKTKIRFGSFDCENYEATSLHRDVNIGTKSVNSASSEGIGADEASTSSLEESGIDTSDGPNASAVEVRRPFHYLVRIPRYDDEKRKEQIRLAEAEVEDMTRKRDAARDEHRKRRDLWLKSKTNWDAAKSEERAARDMFRAKRQEKDSAQSLSNEAKNAMTIEDVDRRILYMEHRIAHETLPLNEEKQLIREIRQLKHLREQLSSNTSKLEEFQHALDQNDKIGEQLKVLGREMDACREKLSKVEAAARAAKKKYDDETVELNKLYAQFESANDIRQKAYAHLQGLKKQLSAKNEYFWLYKNDAKVAEGYAVAGDKEALQHHCINQVETFMELWNKNDEFRREYVRCNTASTLRRLRTLDGRSLGPDEEPPSLGVVDKSTTHPSTNINAIKNIPVVEHNLATKAEIEPKKPVKETVIAGKRAKPTPPRNAEASTSIVVEEEKEEQKPSKELSRKMKGEEEQARKEEELRREEEAARLKEQLRLEEKAKAQEALERKRRNAEKAQARAEFKARKEAEQKEKEREKRARKKKRRGVSAETSSRSTETHATSCQEAPSETINEPEIKESPGTMTKRTHNPAQYARKNKVKSIPPPPPPLRNRGRRRMQQWIWVVFSVVAILALFYLGNINFSHFYRILNFGSNF
ncbi:hypothetical protein Ancab_032941 [Ancistrocladus abbreviatus]